MEVESVPVADVPVKLVPETLLKKRKRDELWAINRKQDFESSKTRNSKNRKLIFKRAEQYIKEYRGQVCCGVYSQSGGIECSVSRLRVQGFAFRNNAWFLDVEQESDLIRLKREAKLKGGFYVEPESKLMFVIRIRG